MDSHLQMVGFAIAIIGFFVIVIGTVKGVRLSPIPTLIVTLMTITVALALALILILTPDSDSDPKLNPDLGPDPAPLRR